MIEAEIVKHIRQTHKFKRTFWDYADFVAYLSPIIFIVLGIFLFKIAILGIFGAIPIIIGIIMGVFTYRGLNQNITFQSISTNSKIDIDKLADKMEEYFKFENIEVDKNLDVIIIYSKKFWVLYATEVTVVVDYYNSTVLINTRPQRIGQSLMLFGYKDNYNLLKWIIDYQLK